jgi:vacuolar-type H+-ATPase subunit E/Vma4
MTAPQTSTTAALTPVREALLQRARADAAGLLADADRDAKRALAQARADAEAILAEARARGEAEASAVLAAQQAQSRREARNAELATQCDAYRELRNRVVARVRRLRDQPDYPVLRERLAAWVQSALGHDAVITEAASGGVVGQAPGRYLDCSLDAVAQRAVDSLNADLEGLWEA